MGYKIVRIETILRVICERVLAVFLQMRWQLKYGEKERPRLQQIKPMLRVLYEVGALSLCSYYETTLLESGNAYIYVA